MLSYWLNLAFHAPHPITHQTDVYWTANILTVPALFSVLRQGHVFLRQLHKLDCFIGIFDFHLLLYCNWLQSEEVPNDVAFMGLDVVFHEYLWDSTVVFKCLDEALYYDLLILCKLRLVDLVDCG